MSYSNVFCLQALMGNTQEDGSIQEGHWDPHLVFDDTSPATDPCHYSSTFFRDLFRIPDLEKDCSLLCKLSLQQDHQNYHPLEWWSTVYPQPMVDNCQRNSIQRCKLEIGRITSKKHGIFWVEIEKFQSLCLFYYFQWNNAKWGLVMWEKFALRFLFHFFWNPQKKPSGVIFLPAGMASFIPPPELFLFWTPSPIARPRMMTNATRMNPTVMQPVKIHHFGLEKEFISLSWSGRRGGCKRRKPRLAIFSPLTKENVDIDFILKVTKTLRKKMKLFWMHDYSNFFPLSKFVCPKLNFYFNAWNCKTLFRKCEFPDTNLNDRETLIFEN